MNTTKNKDILNIIKYRETFVHPVSKFKELFFSFQDV